MTVKELIEQLKEQNQDALVYHDYDGDLAFIITNVLTDGVGKDTVLLS